MQHHDDSANLEDNLEASLWQPSVRASTDTAVRMPSCNPRHERGKARQHLATTCVAAAARQPLAGCRADCCLEGAGLCLRHTAGNMCAGGSECAVLALVLQRHFDCSRKYKCDGGRRRWHVSPGRCQATTSVSHMSARYGTSVARADTMSTCIMTAPFVLSLRLVAAGMLRADSSYYPISRAVTAIASIAHFCVAVWLPEQRVRMQHDMWAMRCSDLR
jgi:hypothetical protein